MLYLSFLSSNAWAFPPGADSNNDGTIDRSELGSYIQMWLNQQVSREETGEVIFAWANEITEPVTYNFAYPPDKLDGYYVLPDDLIGEYGYEIIEGYVEDFTYTADKPIYGAWEIENFNDFSDKCFVGDCNKNNEREVICIDGANTINMEKFICEKWLRPSSSTHGSNNAAYCNSDGLFVIRGTPGFGPWPTCHGKSHINVNFYYFWNTNPNYEGHSTDAQSRWMTNFQLLTQDLATLGLSMSATWYEHQLPEDEFPPAAYVSQNTPLNLGVEQPGDIHISIFAGKSAPSQYGLSCSSDIYPVMNICGAWASGNRIRMGDFVNALAGSTHPTQRGLHFLKHEYGHTLGCPHTGVAGTLSAHLYVDDTMSYGTPFDSDYIYECRIITYLLGRSP